MSLHSNSFFLCSLSRQSKRYSTIRGIVAKQFNCEKRKENVKNYSSSPHWCKLDFLLTNFLETLFDKRIHLSSWVDEIHRKMLRLVTTICQNRDQIVPVNFHLFLSMKSIEKSFALYSPSSVYLGARLAGGDLMKNNSSYSSNQLSAGRAKSTGKMIDSLDLENLHQPRFYFLFPQNHSNEWFSRWQRTSCWTASWRTKITEKFSSSSTAKSIFWR